MSTILYVEDDIDDGLFLKEAFLQLDPSLKFINVQNGVEALQHLLILKSTHTTFPSLIIMDINMPLMDGRLTIKKIKEDPILLSIPIVAFTTSNNPLDRLICKQMGVDCILKPNNALELKEVANTFLKTYIIKS